MRSIAKLTTMKNAATSSTSAWTMVKSLRDTACTKSLPMPFRLNTCSVTTRPPIRNANSRPITVTTGSIAFDSACRTTTRRSNTPLARAVRM